MIITLERFLSNSFATHGVLIKDDMPFAVTLERPWLLNKVNTSCIPAGEYICKRIVSPKFGRTYEITGVEDRSHILFHSGNWVDDSSGCIIVAKEFGELSKGIFISDSKRGMTELLTIVKGLDVFSLKIIDIWRLKNV